jgi:hypothetical protein
VRLIGEYPVTIDDARKWLIIASLGITGAQMLFFVTAPAIGFPLQYPKNLDVLQIISPVFLGYLGSAAHFIFQNPPATISIQNQYLGLLVKGPLAIYTIVVVGAIVSFWYANRPDALPGTGMSVDNLATALSLALGVLAATTGVITSYLFVSQKTT